MSSSRSNLVTVVIKTLGRPSLPDAVKSAIREGFPVVVAVDGDDLSDGLWDQCDDRSADVVVLGRHYGQYGAMAFTVAAAMARTPYVAVLDDDDEFVEGAGRIIHAKIVGAPEVDVWLSMVQYKNGTTRGGGTGLKQGNCCEPIFKTEVLARCPMHHFAIETQVAHFDYYHVKECSDAGFNLQWIGEPTILVRPKLAGDAGKGIPQ